MDEEVKMFLCALGVIVGILGSLLLCISWEEGIERDKKIELCQLKNPNQESKICELEVELS